jgi:protein ImuA
VDEALPGGFPRGALSELRGGPASGKTAVALSLVAALPGDELAAFVDGTGEFYPPAAEALGVDLGRLLLVRPGAFAGASAVAGGGRGEGSGGKGKARGDSGRPREEAGALQRKHETRASAALGALWAAEALLSSGAFAVVILDVPMAPGVRGADALLRRLQTAAEKGGSIGLWLSTPGTAARVPAGVRLELSVRGGRIVARREGRLTGRAAGDGHAA